MLIQLLAQLTQGNIATLAGLANHLEVSVDLLEQMLHDLERAGYIVAVDTNCQHNCAHCAQASSCGLMAQGRLWSVTAKGLEAARV